MNSKVKHTDYFERHLHSKVCVYPFPQIGDNQCLLQSLKDSSYYKSFEDKASVWEQKLADLDEYLQNLNQIQRKWVYLEPIFGRGALPKEQGRFKRVDDDFRYLLIVYVVVFICLMTHSCLCCCLLLISCILWLCMLFAVDFTFLTFVYVVFC